MTKPALIIVDVQNDFVEGGSLAVTGGKAVAEKLTEYLRTNADDYSAIITTQDWHIDPGTHWADGEPNYVTTWPKHCEAFTQGSDFAEPLRTQLNSMKTEGGSPWRILKGEYEDAYSGFEGHEVPWESILAEKTPEFPETGTLVGILAKEDISDVHVVGLATDHCVKATAFDALDNGFNVTVLTQFIAGVDPEASQAALKDMETKGATIA